jgi:hypothetical protein
LLFDLCNLSVDAVFLGLKSFHGGGEDAGGKLQWGHVILVSPFSDRQLLQVANAFRPKSHDRNDLDSQMPAILLTNGGIPA